MRQPKARTPAVIALAFSLPLAGVLALLAGCGSDKQVNAPAPLPVSVLTVTARDTPISQVFIAQTQSSQAVNIQARVSGFLDQRVYHEGSMVKAGQILFEMDKKPFQAQVDGAAAALQRHEAALQVAATNLARVKPLVQENALSQKELDDAQGQYEQSAAAVAQAKAQLEAAQLDLSYATIRSPVDGVSSYAAVADGTYLDAQNSQLTTVSVLSPMWINFSLSENELNRVRRERSEGLVQAPKSGKFDVEITLGDGSVFPHKGKITFADPSYNSDTGTFLIRAVVDNPDGILRPNQYVRTRVIGAIRPNAILVPQRAVQLSSQGHFVWIVDSDNKAELRPVVVGDWEGDSWFINQGLASGDRVVVDGSQRLAVGQVVTAHELEPKDTSGSPAPSTGA